ncbi:MAG: WD40 repeat domain-containing protein, partial [Isosphaeraceae bacterium]
DVFESASARHVTRLECGKIRWCGGLCFDTESRRIALLAARPDGRRQVQSWDLAARDRDPHSWLIEEGATFFDTQLKGGFLVVARGGRMHLLDVWTGTVRVELAGPQLSNGSRLELLAFSADGRVFAAHTVKNSILLWDTDSGRELAGCEEVLGGACRIALSPTGSQLAMLSNQGRLVVFDRSTSRSRVLTAGSQRIVKYHSLSFSSDEDLLAVGRETHPGGAQPPEVWDIATAKRLAVFPGSSFGEHVFFLPSRRSLIVMGGAAPRIWRIDPPSAPDALAGHAAEAWAAVFAPDGKVLATGSDDTRERQTIKLWDPASGRLRAGWKAHTATVAALAFSPDGRLFASGSLDSGKPGNPNVILWDATSCERLAILDGHAGSVRSVAFSPDGRLLATASDDGTARLWDIAEKKTRTVLEGHAAQVNSIVFSPDGRLLATGSNDATVRLWDVATGRAVATLSDDGNVFAVAFSPDGARLASVNEEGAIKLWDLSQGALLRTIRGDSAQLRCLAFTADGRNIVAAGKGKVVRIWDVATGQELLSLEGHQAQINALAFSPDGSILASCDHQGKVKLWRADPIETVPAR